MRRPTPLGLEPTRGGMSRCRRPQDFRTPPPERRHDRERFGQCWLAGDGKDAVTADGWQIARRPRPRPPGVDATLPRPSRFVARKRRTPANGTRCWMSLVMPGPHCIAGSERRAHTRPSHPRTDRNRRQSRAAGKAACGAQCAASRGGNRKYSEPRRP
eukprot:scaffold251527_cov30-Tisochrysis_lutea.AAC.2